MTSLKKAADKLEKKKIQKRKKRIKIAKSVFKYWRGNLRRNYKF